MNLRRTSAALTLVLAATLAPVGYATFTAPDPATTADSTAAVEVKNLPAIPATGTPAKSTPATQPASQKASTTEPVEVDDRPQTATVTVDAPASKAKARKDRNPIYPGVPDAKVIDDHAHPMTREQKTRKSDTASLYRQAGLTPPVRLAGASTDPGTNNANGAFVPGLNSHVDQSCAGTGTDGNRVQAMYVRETDTPSRYNDVVPIILNELRTIDDIYALSSEATGGAERIRWVRSPGSCTPEVRHVVLPDGAMSGSFNEFVWALQAAGYNEKSRKYLNFLETTRPFTGTSASACALGGYFDDDRAVDNLNDGKYANFATVNSNCWVRNFQSAAAHELTHMMGAVQMGAPNATTMGHCKDIYELMCYDDGGGASVQTCGGNYPRDGLDYILMRESSEFLDCNKDDYFNTNPAPGSYLASHWNVAKSTFLDEVAPLPPAPTVTITSSMANPEAGDTFTLTATSPTATSFEWDLSKSCAVGSKTQSTLTVRCMTNVGGAGPMLATVKAHNGSRYGVARRKVFITPVPGPSVNISGPATAEPNTDFTVTATPTAGKTPFTYKWTNPEADCVVVGSTTGPSFTRRCNTNAVSSLSPMVAGLQVTSLDGQKHSLSHGVRIVAGEPPEITFTGTPTVTAGTTTEVTAESDNPNTTYRWTSPTGRTLTGATTATVKVTIPAGATPGTEKLNLVATASNGGKSTSTYTYEVAPKPTLTIGAPVAIYFDQPTTVTTSTNRDDATVTWAADNPNCSITPTTGNSTRVNCNTNAVDSDVTVTASLTTNDQVTVTATKSLPVMDPQEGPALTLIAPTTGESGVAVPLRVTNSGAPVASWRWSASKPGCLTNNTAPEATLHCALDQDGVVTVSITGTTDSGVTERVVQTIDLSRPSVKLSIYSSQTSVYFNTKVTLTGEVNHAATGRPVKATIGFRTSTNGGATWNRTIDPTLQPDGTRSSVLTVNSSTRMQMLVNGLTSAPTLTVRSQKRPVTASITGSTTRPTVFTGTFKDATTGRMMGTLRVQLQVKPYGARYWSTLNTYYAPSGKASVRTYVRRAGYYRFRYGGSTAYVASYSKPIWMRPHTSMSMGVRRNVFTGRLALVDSYGLRSQRVVLQRRFANSSTWVSITSRYTNRNAVVSVRYRPGRAAYVRWVYPGNKLYRPVVSRAVWVRR